MADSERMGSRKGDNCNNGAAQSSAESELFEVEKILSKSKSAGKLLYKVRWKGYGPEDDTWEPVRNLGSCKDIIEEFENKLREAARKRAEERRLQKLMMESRAGKPESQDSNSPYPANFKNTFWKELEAGRVNVFDNDMYSKVKSKRAATQGKSNSDTSSNEDNMKSSSEKGKSTSSSHKKKTHKTHSSLKPKNTSTPKTTIAIISETETDENSQPQDVNFCESGDETLDKPAPLSLVIRRVSDTSPDTRAPARNTHSESPNYTVLPKSNPERSSSSRKKSKKHHKHHKRKLSKEKESRNSKRREPSCDTAVFTPGNSKKRKISEDTAVSTVDSPVNRSEKGDDIWNMLLHDDTDKLNHPESHQMTESIKDISPNSPVTSCEPENTSKSTEISTDSVLTVTHAQNNEFAIPKSSDLNKSNTCDREKLADLPLNVSRISNTSVHGQSVKEEQVVCPGSSTDCFPLTPQEPDASLFSSFTDSMASEMQSLCRQNSDTFDSGVYSPISEKSGRSLGLELTGEGDRVPILPLLGDKNKGSDKADCGGDLEIELDDLDWDLFDKEVTFTPTTLSNEEFAGAVWSGDYELVRRALLGDGKYNMDTRDNEGRTLLMHTVKHGHDDISHLLVENGADVNGKTSTGWTPLMIACQHAEIQTVSLLLEMGAHVNMTSAEGMTPLIVISKRGHTQILWLLLECGANFNAVTATGHTASDITRLLYYTDMQNILHSHIQRVMAEYNKQVSVTLNQTARVLSSMFPAQVYNVCEGPTFTYSFHHTLSPPNSGLGYLLFIGQSMFSSEEVKCRLYGPCAVKAVTLNGHPLASLTDCGNFVLAFSPLINGRNTITIHALSAQEAKAKLIMCAYKAQLCNS